MLRDQAIHLSNRWLRVVKWIAAFVAAFIGACLKADKTSPHLAFLASGLTYIQSQAWWALPLSTFAALGSQSFQSRIGSNHQWGTIQVLLNQFRDETFGQDETKDDPQYFHRVTIFKHVRWRFCIKRWPLCGWLIPMSRSGVATKSHIKCFKASLNAPTKAEGIAGRAFVNQKELRAYDLPNLSVQRATADDIKLYAERTFIDVKLVKNPFPASRSLLAIPLEVDGKPWGVIVLDSQNPRQIQYSQSVYGVIAKACNTLLR